MERIAHGPRLNHFNTSHVSINQITTGTCRPKNTNFNTSHVSINLT